MPYGGEPTSCFQLCDASSLLEMMVGLSDMLVDVFNEERCDG
jgi:hypothetical protein